MRPKIYWIDVPAGARLAIMPRPRAGDWLDDEIAGWRGQGIDVVVSLLQGDEVEELGLQREPDLCHDAGMEFISFPSRTVACRRQRARRRPLPRRLPRV